MEKRRSQKKKLLKEQQQQQPQTHIGSNLRHKPQPPPHYPEEEYIKRNDYGGICRGIFFHMPPPHMPR
jgi:hypothetical protein